MFKLLMISRLLLELCNGVWMIEPNAAQAYYPVVKALLTNPSADISHLLPQSTSNYGAWKAENELVKREMSCKALFMSEPGMHSPSVYYGFDKAPKGSVSLIPVQGAIMKYDYCGAFGTQTLSQWVAEADAHPNIIGHILRMDTPGGAVNGTADFAQVILNTQKPVVAFCDGYMCSAGYWLASGANEIIGSNETIVVGSIGTYMTIEDLSKQLEADGIMRKDIYATKSTDKNALFKEAIAGNDKPIIADLLDPMNEAFLSAVKKNRRGKGMDASQVLTGKTFVGSRGVPVGLLDRMGTLADAVNSVKKLSKS